MTAWHVSEETLARFAADSSSFGEPMASSIEMHLVACAECRGALAVSTPQAAIDTSWDRVADLIDRPRAPLAAWLFGGMGFDDSRARLVAATPALRGSWLVAMVAIVAGVVAVTRQSHDPSLFLALAPLLPLLAVAASFWPAADPAGEAGLATPLTGLGLLLRRAGLVVALSALALGAAAFAVPDIGVRDIAWLLPALALATSAVALSTWIGIERATGGLVVVWFVGLAYFGAHRSIEVRGSAWFGSMGELGFAALAVAAVAVTIVRRESFARARRMA